MRPPMIVQDKHLAGATPEKLAKALLRNEVAVKKVPANQSGHRVPHLRKGS